MARGHTSRRLELSANKVFGTREDAQVHAHRIKEVTGRKSDAKDGNTRPGATKAAQLAQQG
jgi:hypothetical protein